MYLKALCPSTTLKFTLQQKKGLTKTLLIMKLTAITLLTACFAASAGGHSQTVTLKEKNALMQTVFEKIQKQTGYTFWYEDQLIQKTKPVDITIQNASLDQALQLLFKDQPLSYEIVGKTIAITERKVAVANKEKDIPITPIEYSGRITDEEGKALFGASVKVKGTHIGTSTDASGLFKLDILAVNAVLEISFVGFEKQTVGISYLKSANNNIIILKKSDSPLDVVQVEAYRTNTRRLSTGNITTVKASVIEKQPVSNPLLALQGRVPGLFITQTNGLSGTGVTVRIQGQNSIRFGNDPLYIVDGVPYPSQFLTTASDILGTSNQNSGSAINGLDNMGKGNPLSYINPGDIESIEVLKDADATSIYGSRAANGVIMITTKKGKAGKTSVNVNVQNGWGKVPRKLDMLNTQQYMELRRVALANSGLTINTLPFPYSIDQFKYFYYPDFLAVWDTTRYTDWQEELIGGTAKYTNVQASVSGGNEFTQILLSASYHKETTVFPGDFADQKGSVHLNFNHQSTDRKFSVQFSANYQMGDNHLPSSDLTSQAILLAPCSPALYNPDGSLNWQPYTLGGVTYYGWDNPLAKYVGTTYNNKTYNLVSNGILSYQVIPGLKLSSSFGYNELSSDELLKMPLTASKPSDRVNTNRLSIFGNAVQRSWIIEPQVNYETKVWKGKLQTTIGASYQRNVRSSYQLTAQNFASDQLMEDLKSAGTITVNNTFNSKYRYNAGFGRVNYNVEDKYLLNLSARRDGSTRFGANNLFHTFWSAAGAWVFSKESFIEKHLPFVSFGKIRASYGTAGNDMIDDYLFLDIYSSVAGNLPYNGATGLAPTTFPNPNLQWEEIRKLQFGFDLGMFNDRVLIGLNYFRNRSSNQLLAYVLPSLTGAAYVTTNFDATVQNTGWEISLNTDNIKKKDFTWSTNFNITASKNKLVEFPALNSSAYSTILIVGEPSTLQKVYHFLGVNPATGLNEAQKNDGTATNNPSQFTDQLSWVNQIPKFYGGFGNNVKYKGFELDFLFQFVKQTGKDFYYGNFPGQASNQPAWVMDYWKKPGDITDHQKPLSGLALNATNIMNIVNFSDAAYRDASYIRLRNASLSWSAPAGWVSRIGLKQCRLYMHGQNLLTFTKYKGLDPETKSSSSLPVLRVITFGIQLGL